MDSNGDRGTQGRLRRKGRGGKRFSSLFYRPLRAHRKSLRHFHGLLAHGIVAVDKSPLDKSISPKKSVRHLVDGGGVDEQLLDPEVSGQALHMSEEPPSNSPSLAFWGDGDCEQFPPGHAPPESWIDHGEPRSLALFLDYHRDNVGKGGPTRDDLFIGAIDGKDLPRELGNEGDVTTIRLSEDQLQAEAGSSVGMPLAGLRGARTGPSTDKEIACPSLS